MIQVIPLNLNYQAFNSLPVTNQIFSTIDNSFQEKVSLANSNFSSINRDQIRMQQQTELQNQEILEQAKKN